MEAVVGVVALAVGVAVGFLVRKAVAQNQALSAEAKSRQLVLEAEREAERLTREALVRGQGRDRRVAPRGRGGRAGSPRGGQAPGGAARPEGGDDRSQAGRRRQAGESSSTTATRSCSSCGSSWRRRPTSTGAARADRADDLAGGPGALRTQVVEDAKRAAMTTGPGDRAAGPRGGRGARPQDRDDRDPAGRLRADGGVHRVGVRAPERGHEGPDHRPRGPQHPRLRGDDRREPHHRRHARGRRALVLRPGPARGGADDAREARRRTGGSTRRGSRRSTSAPSASSRSRSAGRERTPSPRSASPTSTRR